MRRYLIYWLRGLPCAVVAFIAAAWVFGAICYDGPFGSGNRAVAALLVIALLVLPWFVKRWLRKVAVFVVLFAVILIWWFSLSPTNNADWQADVANVAWADVQGDEVTFHNVRNCDYRTETDYTAHWETRTVHLSKLTGVDLALIYWGSPYIAHPIVSFQFADAPPLCFSIETRKKIGQSYSTIGGIYRQFELIYVVADERDVIRLRSNYRKGEDVYLYRTTLSRLKRADASLNIFVRSMGCETNRAGTTPSPLTARQVFAPSIRLTGEYRGIGGSCSMAKATN